MENEYKIATGVIQLPEEIKQLICENISETLRELGATRKLPKGVEFRLGYAAGCRDTINRLFLTGKLRWR